MSVQEWQIKSATGACSACDRAFEGGETFTSRLAFVPGEGYGRADFCAGCWDEAQREGAVSVWRSVYQPPAPPPPEALRKETAESLLRQLMESDDPGRRDAIFVLAVMLERKRTLVERDVQFPGDGRKVRVYEHRGTGETFVVTDPQLRLDDLERVQQQVVLLLGGRPPGGAADPAVEDASAPAAEGEAPLPPASAPEDPPSDA